MKINDLNYWNKFYKERDKKIFSSNFAKFLKKKIINKKSNILEIGTGNGRDAFYFSKYSKSVIAIDQSKIAINNNKLRVKRLKIKNLIFKSLSLNNFLKIKKKNQINLIYARFFIHSINQNKENFFLKKLVDFNNLKPLIVLEFRTTKDKLMKKGKRISKFERYTDHYRRFIETNKFEKKIKNMGFIIIYKKFGINLSKTKNDNPHLCRIIFKKK
tara:strand:- start:75 stop:719 length:645 start_codon:yes stop_codon:yes gene_type:complete